jgi:predicted transcriptional regulator
MNDDTTMKPPCMVVVQYILPALRVAISRQLVNELNLKRSEAAKKMDVTPAAITQYLNKSRGDKAINVIKSSERINELIIDLAKDLADSENPSDIQLLKLCRTCQAIRSEGLICELHKEAMPSLQKIGVCACSMGLVETINRL